MTRFTHGTFSLLVLLLGVQHASPATAAEQRIRGGTLVVKSRLPGNPTTLKIQAAARERRSTATVIGDPTIAGSAGGAILELTLNGALPTWQGFRLTQGTTRRGAPFWRALGTLGYRYADPKGERGPVRAVVIKRTPDGSFRLRATLHGRQGGLRLRPPDPGTDGALVLRLAGGDTYCVRYGADAKRENDGERLFRIARPIAEGCPTSGSFLALSYNVAGLPEGISGSHPATNTPLISPRLNGYDLVVVQESWQTPDPNPLAPTRVYHELLVADALHPYKSVPAPQPLGADPDRPSAQVSDGLNTLSWFPFEPVVRVAWDGCFNSAFDCLALKGFSVARTTLAPDVLVDVYDLHMEAGSQPEDDVLRDAGVTQLATFINSYSAGRAVIVGGDFNLHTDDEPDASQFQRLLAETELQDVCATLGCPEPGRIDKFLFRSSAALTFTPLSWRFETDVFRGDDGEPLSDHDALAVRFAWTFAGP